MHISTCGSKAKLWSRIAACIDKEKIHSMQFKLQNKRMQNENENQFSKL